jgi:hypothetical protein
MLYLKAALFIVAGTTAGCLVVVRQPTLMTAALIVTTVWAFCRAYYFAFYVIERYVDSTCQFSGIISFLRYVLSRRREAAPVRGSQ